MLEAFAAAARTAYEGGVLSDQAEEGRALATVDHQRTALLAAVGHDLRTPWRGSKRPSAACDRPTSSGPTTERRELLTTIEEATDRLDGVIHNLLDASRLEAGALVVSAAPVALDELMAGALLDLPATTPGWVAVDVPEDLRLVVPESGLFKRVLVNLLENAFAHGASEGPVEVARVGAESAKVEVDRPRAGGRRQHDARTLRAVPAPRRPRSRRRRAGSLRRSWLRRGDGRRHGRRPHRRRRPDDANPPAAWRRPETER